MSIVEDFIKKKRSLTDRELEFLHREIQNEIRGRDVLEIVKKLRHVAIMPEHQVRSTVMAELPKIMQGLKKRKSLSESNIKTLEQKITQDLEWVLDPRNTRA